MSERIVLASGSRFRRAMLEAAGVDLDVVPAEIDERAVEQTLEGTGASPEDLAQVLAEAKALEVSERQPGRLVLGCDQTLSLDNELFHKSEDMEDARRHLLKLSGRTHQLSIAAVLARNGTALWRHVGIARLTMRRLEPSFIGRHLARVGPMALNSVESQVVDALW